MDRIETSIKNVNDLTTREAACWERFRRENRALYSPYFRLAYAQIVASLCKDVHVLVIRRNGQPIAFLPFQAKIGPFGRVGFARPVGAPMTDYHGFICAEDLHLDVISVLKQAGFGVWHFSGLVDSCDLMRPYVKNPVPCTVMNLPDGAEAWRAGRDASYRRHLKNHRRQVRKTAELGKREFLFQTDRQDIYDQLMTWKTEQFARTGKYNVIAAPWVRNMLDILWKRGARAEFRADMHALLIGGEPAAIDLGLTDGVTFHSWIIAYNSKFHKVGPGIQLLEALIDTASELGYRRIDLGEGIDGYKRHYATREASVSSGFIAVSGPAAALSKLYGSMEEFSESKFGRPGKLPGKLRRRYSQIAACDPSLTGRSKAMIEAVLKSG